MCTDNNVDNAISTRPIPGSSSSARLGSPSSVSVSSSSPFSAAFLSMAGVSTTTPLSSLDGWEARSPTSVMGRTRADVVASHGALDANVESGATRSSCSIEVDSHSLPREVASASFPAQSRPPAQVTEASHRGAAGPQFLTNSIRQNNLLGSNDFINTDATESSTCPASVSQASLSSSTHQLTSFRTAETPSSYKCLVSKNHLGQAASFSSALVRPKFLKSPPPPQQPAIVRTTSSHRKLALRQPVPDTNVRSGAFAGSIAQLEASAERLSMTSSIDDAIREEHQELKRSDSRRSSILSASIRQIAAQTASDSSFTLVDTSSFQCRPTFSRRNSIIELNSALRTAVCFSPSNHNMSSTSSVSGTGLRRPGSKGNSIDNGNILPAAGEQSTAANSGLPFMSRHGPGKASVHSNRSGPLVLPEITETDPRTTLTWNALDDAGRLMASESNRGEGATHSEAHGHPVPDQISVSNAHVNDLTNNHEFWGLPAAGKNAQHAKHNPTAFEDYRPYTSETNGPYGGSHGEGIQQQRGRERPTSSASVGTYDQAEAAFGDFDGVHCDPDAANDHPVPRQLQADVPPPLQLPRHSLPPRPTSYFDPGSGRQMLYYPARVPAMLSLPPKLSKKPKAADRNNRRSQVLSMFVQSESSPREEQHQTHNWLPDPLAGDLGSPLLDTEELTNDAAVLGLSAPTQAARAAIRNSESFVESSPLPDAGTPVVGDPRATAGPLGGSSAPGPSNLGRPPRLVDPERRKSRMAMLSSLPPQLRASAFFDLPASTADVQVKNGSAMDTLDSILDAAASAPVSAFTDHAFAGRLGAEVYGMGKKRNKRNTITVSGASGSSREGKGKNTPYADQKDDHAKSKTRGSFVSLVGHIRKVNEPVGKDDDDQSTRSSANRRHDITADGGGDGVPSLEREGTASLLAPDEDEQSAEEDADVDQGENGEDGDELYEGAPTTLLAELQLRKQQQKLRTQPAYKAFPNGMHSTLLELDAVAEIERKARKGKKVNLAWEDPSMNHGEDDDDDDVPLGLLFAAKAAGHGDISAVVAEINRPLGLIERKELEDNEPLSRRRDRLQGRNPGVNMYLARGDNAMKRQNMLGLTPTMAAVNRQLGGAGLPDRAADISDEVGEVEDEPLAARLRRIKAKEESELPKARPVSTAFSAELLSHFGDPEEDAKERLEGGEKGTAKDRAKLELAEEEETLGQRRRRLQAEREARETEMLLTGGAFDTPTFNNQALDALTGTDQLTQRISMANVLSAHPLESARGARDPREAERQQKANSAARAAREKEQRMAAMRAQMPQATPTTSIGDGLSKTSGFIGGQYNSNGGGLGMSSLMPQTSGPALGPWVTSGGMTRPAGNAVRLNSLAAVNHPGGMGLYPGNMDPRQSSMATRANTMHNGYGYSHAYGVGQSQALGVGMAAGPFSGAGFGVGFGTNSYAGYAPHSPSMPMQIPVPPPGQVDRVERWRQSVMP
ncbi:hypothetical protein CMQ_6712 [Grosmannia clavigera kw1407]|uniref:Uncharacterized protein n=1 Tax=Grosmannia clavigera (strain kw1407 / UAMH 11150) TaxID=655863 RepID=F0X7V8_GROCL|nr:uncharacterized protein CMQ_6712 [Grosmannia clavigera kw1407]EFX06391.1 hypothetical protein CMQ_6712 [Grosmannia clavigera kw1407]